MTVGRNYLSFRRDEGQRWSARNEIRSLGTQINSNIKRLKLDYKDIKSGWKFLVNKQDLKLRSFFAAA